ncbi:MAG: fumarate hydratase C-terminal domain-containing protein [Lachnospiraceae bacterium]|nr:fumarate hydratase C-terminal domain-containing protein [Lachnospiraceae bacterium]
MSEYHLQSPLQESDIRKLRVGDTVFLSGKAFTCRSKLQRSVFDEGLAMPKELLDNDILIHAGPIILKEGDSWQLVSIMPTSSVRFEKWGADSIKEWGLKVIVGKTTMREKTAEAMQKYGCVHLSPQSVSPNLWHDQIDIQGVYLFDEMGSIEAPWQFELNEFGPFVVDMDTEGNSLYEQVDDKVRENLVSAHTRMGIEPDFKYTQLYGGKGE